MRVGTIGDLKPYIKPGDILECVTSIAGLWKVGKHYKVLPSTYNKIVVETDDEIPKASSISTFRLVNPEPVNLDDYL